MIALCLLVSWTSSSLAAQSNLKERMQRYFISIESDKDDRQSTNHAIQAILQLGTPTIPLVRERFNATHHPSYFYLLQKLQQAKPREDKWDKQHYFAARFAEAKRLLNQGETEKAWQLARAITVLEPALAFAADLKTFMHRCKDEQFSQRIVGGKITATRAFYPLGRKIVVQFSLTNYRKSPITLLSAGEHGIVVDVLIKQFSLNGNSREQQFSRIITISDSLQLMPAKTYSYELPLDNPTGQSPVFRRYKITARIPRCHLTQGEQSWYPRIYFGERNVVSLPQNFQQVAKTPLNVCLQALKLGYPHHLFFASFFVDRREAARLIPALIAKNETPQHDLAAISQVVLRRITGKNFSTRRDWENWWEARGLFWETEINSN